MASPAEGASSNGFGSPDRSDDRMLDGGRSREISIPSPTRSSVEFKSPDRSWDTMSGTFDSPRSPVSTSSIESPSSSSLTKSQSSKMKSRRNHSAYYDEETGTWKCRNCGGTYDVPNPGSRQRREHKKACEETQRLQAIKRALEEKARNEEAARLAALRDEGLVQEASKQQEILRGNNTDELLQNGHDNGSEFGEDPGILGVFDTTPVIPEREEVNFEAPKELIHNIERDSAGRLHETQEADAESSKSNGQERRLGQDGAELDGTQRVTMEDKFQETDLPPKRDLSAAQQGAEGKAGSPLKSGLSGESSPTNGSSTPTSTTVDVNGSLDHHWIDKDSPFQKPPTSPEFEPVKYYRRAASNGTRLEETVYDRLVDLHDDPQVMVTRSASMGHGSLETARIASLNHDRDTAAKGVHFTRALSLDHYGSEEPTRNDSQIRHAAQLDRVTEAAVEGEAPSGDPSPDALIEVLIGRNQGRTPSSNLGVSPKRNHSKVLVNGFSDDRIGHFPTAAPSVVSSRRTQLQNARAVGSSSKEQSDRATAARSKQTQSQNSGEAGDSSRNQSDNSEEDDNLVAIIARNVGKFWKQAAAFGAVAVIAWVGKSLANKQGEPRGQAHRYRRAPCPVAVYYWDE